MASSAAPEPVGRQHELGVLLRAAAAAAGGRAQLVVVSGESGMGKTTLVDALLARLSNTVVLRGACFPYTSGDLAYSAFVQAFRRVSRHPAVGALSPSDRAALAPLFPLSVEEAPRDHSRWRQTRFAELTLRLVGDLAAERPLVLVVEDLHWTDQGTIDLLSFLALNLSYERVLLVGTVRTDEPERPPWARTGLAELQALPRGQTVALTPLEEADAVELWRRVAGRAADDDGEGAAAAAVRRAGGNPFFLTELAAEGGAGASRGPQRLALRLAALEPTSRLVLRLLALAGLPLPDAVVRAAVRGAVAGDSAVPAETPVDDAGLDGALRRLLDAHLAVLTEGGELTVRHGLLADAVEADLLPGERTRLHGALAHAATQAGDAFPRSSEAMAVAARQWQLAGDPARALAPLIEAARSAAARHSEADAARLFAESLDAWDEVPAAARPADVSRLDLLLRYARTVGSTADAAAGADRVAEQLRGDASAPAAERVALYEQLAHLRHELGDDDEALAAAEQAVRLASDPDLLVPPALAARALATSGAVHLMRGEYALGLAPLEEALVRSRGCGATAETAYALSLAGAAMSNLGRIEEGEAALREAVSLSSGLDDPEGQARSYLNLSYVHENDGAWEPALTAAEAGLEVARRHGLEHTAGAWLSANQAYALLALGRWVEADRLLGTALDRPAPPAARRYLQLLRIELDVACGRTDRAGDELAAVEAITSADAVSEGQLSLDRALLAESRGDLDQVLAAIAGALAVEQGELEPVLGLRLCALGLRSWAARAEQRRLASSRGTNGAGGGAAGGAGGGGRAQGGAAELVRWAEQLAGQAHDLRPCQDEWQRCRLEHDRVRGQGRAADWEAFAVAQTVGGQPYTEAYAWSVAAQLWLAEGAGRRDRAGAAVRRAATILTALGEVSLRRRVVALAASCRVRLDAPALTLVPAPTSAVASDLGLTPREHQVLERVAAGDTNRQIGSALFISERTAGVHVGNILAKLQVRSRAEATASAHRLGLVR